MEQKTYPIDKHHFPIDLIDPQALQILDKFHQAGFTAYLVGGSVRDLLLQHRPKDFDISTSAKPEEIKKIFRNCILIGKRFRLAHIRYGKKVFEVSTFRAGNTESDTLIIRDNEWGSPEEDALRRDFTINGLFYDHVNKTIIDYVGGYQDIQKKYLRTIGQPFLRFKQDPVRMIRLLKFQARLGFDVDSDTHVALLDCRSEILKSSPARILEELLRMLESGAATSFFRLLLEHGFIQQLLPVVGEYIEHSEGEEIYAYLREIDSSFKEAEKAPLDRAILLSCLAYPLLQNRIQHNYIDRNRPIHLGEIQGEASDLLDGIFRLFFHVPRRLRIMVISILTSQYRLTPIEKKRSKRLRIPNDPNFQLALQFLEIRSCLEPGLQVVFEEWNSAFHRRVRDASKKRKRKNHHDEPKSQTPHAPNSES
ncbi:MAG: polynucleotide adenylyltransferase PcnB [Chlamydiae bacterium]|nr:polynucleotide adenylyltransferase PcnB [Chlamydiota bacterium]